MIDRDRYETNGSSCTLRRLSGPEADELFIVCRPRSDRSADVGSQTASAYRMLHDILNACGGDVSHIVRESVFFRDIRRSLRAFHRARNRMLAELSGSRCQPALTCIGQPPLPATGTALEILALAVIPRRRDLLLGRTVWNAQPCGCRDCWRSATRVVPLGDQEHLYVGNIYGSHAGHDAFGEVLSMFESAEQLLHREGLGFQQVVRTWIHLRDIDRDYAELNRARREFFRRSGVSLRPASTGIQGTPFPDGHRFSMSLYAIRSAEPLQVERMSAPTLNEAWSYGSDFSRGLRVVEANKVALYVSGTASVDEKGRTAHVGDLDAQVARMLLNISTLLTAQNASLRDLVSAVTYVKHPGDARRLYEILRQSGLGDLPNVVVEAAVCRPELLCEMEAVAVLP